MRWPLRYQVMLPMTIVMLAVVTILSALNAYFAAQQLERRISAQVDDVAETLATSSFPLTDAVLDQMKGLAGADFLLLDFAGRPIASTRAVERGVMPPASSETNKTGHLRLVAPVRWNGQRFFHAAIQVRSRPPRNTPLVLHVLYSEDAYLRQRREAVLPPLLIGCLALVVVMGLALVIAARVSRPLRRLRGQVDKIARGDFRPFPLPRRGDEVRDLAVAVNQMATMLSQYEERIRGTERVRLLAQLGGGLAHQLRNSATGARMALDLHRRDCTDANGRESLDVATRQLVLIEQYLKKFLALGSRSERQHARYDLARLVKDLVPLVTPAARHAGVDLRIDDAMDSVVMHGDADAIEQLVLNLLLNAIEAAGQLEPRPERAGVDRFVHVALRRDVPNRVMLVVEDSGPGPSDVVAATMFEPFVTDKRDGVGLGLAVAKEVATSHAGSIGWDHAHGRTAFIVELPIQPERTRRGEVAYR